MRTSFTIVGGQTDANSVGICRRNHQPTEKSNADRQDRVVARADTRAKGQVRRGGDKAHFERVELSGRIYRRHIRRNPPDELGARREILRNAEAGVARTGPCEPSHSALAALRLRK